MRRKIIVISDLHIGGENAPSNLDYIVSFLKNLNPKEHTNLIIAGDMFDRWAHPIDNTPPSFEVMKNANSSFWNALNNCSMHENISVFYMNGNHDQEMTQVDLTGNGEITHIDPDTYWATFGRNVYVDHGHCIDLFNAPGHSDNDEIQYPLGYFKTRLNHSIKHIPMHRDYHLDNAKAQVIEKLWLSQNIEKVSKTELDELLSSISEILLQGLKKDILYAFGLHDEFLLRGIYCNMPENYYNLFDKVSYEYVLENYRGFVDRFYYHQLLPSLFSESYDPLIVPWKAFSKSIDVIRTGGLGWFAEVISSKYNPRVIVFGHTHMNQIKEIDYVKTSEENLNYNFKRTYANSGCWCSNDFGPNTTSIYYDELDELLSRNLDIRIRL